MLKSQTPNPNGERSWGVPVPAQGRIAPGGSIHESVPPYRRKVGVLLLIVLTGYAVLNLLWQGIRSCADLPATDPVTIHEARIAQLLPLLPATGEVGYVTTVENDRIFSEERSFVNVEFVAQYVLTQYTLAPRIVRNRPDLPLVVGNFIDGPPAPGFLEKNGLVPLKDFGDGLVLYRREPKP